MLLRALSACKTLFILDTTVILACDKITDVLLVFDRSTFNRYGNWKHHCRLCGRVICDNCSKNTPLYLNMSTCKFTLPLARDCQSDCHLIQGVLCVDPGGTDAVGHTRACKECVHTVFKRREHAADRKRPNAVLKYYGSLMRLKERIDAALPNFQEMIASLG